MNILRHNHSGMVHMYVYHMNLVMNILRLNLADNVLMYVLQAWAFATGVRLVTGKVPFMNMENFDKSVWVLHRRLFHRFVKYFKYFRKATETLTEFQQAIADALTVKVKTSDTTSTNDTITGGDTTTTSLPGTSTTPQRIADCVDDPTE